MRKSSGMKIIFYVVMLFLFAIQAPDAQWSEQTSNVTSVLYSVSAFNNNNVWICGASGVVLRTTNAGANWVSVTPNAALNFYTIWALDANIALVAGATSDAFVYETTNGGANWSQVFNQTGGFIDGIGERVDSLELLLVGNPVGGRWTVWRSRDMGFDWDSSNFYLPQTGTETGFRNSFFLHTMWGGWFGTNNSRIYRRGNTTFTPQPLPGMINSEAVWFNDMFTGMVGGDSLMAATTNAGTNWTPITAPGTGTILGIAGSGGNWWYVRGNSIYRSSNDGTSWSNDYTAPAGTYNHISISRSGGSMWAVRTNGGISTSLGLTGISPGYNAMPLDFVLLQNYPNPFNPATSIEFVLPKSGHVKLAVFDVLGKEVKTLVNEFRDAGTYKVDFNASNLASGVYFYRIEAANFTEARKMVLVK